MPASSRLHYLWLAYLSRPEHERALYRLIRREKPHQIVEIGIGDGRRTMRMIRAAARFAGGDSIRYAGIDLFEARAAGTPGLSLKQTHQLLKRSGARVQLIPGDPLSALTRAANALGNTDLMIISAIHDEAALRQAWFYVPRMLHARSCVLWESGTEDGLKLRRLETREIRTRAGAQSRRHAA